MKKIALLTASAGMAALTFSISASAAPVLFCSSGPGINLVTTGCISGQSNAYIGGGDGVYSNAGGGDPEAAVEAAILAATGTGVNISLYGKSDSNPGLFDFPDGLTSVKTGSWDVLNNNILIKYITVKAANSFALYEMAGLGVNFGTFSTAGILNNGGQQPVVSHISFWTATGAVPEPASWGMMIVGLGAVGIAMRRRQQVSVSFS